MTSAARGRLDWLVVVPVAYLLTMGLVVLRSVEISARTPLLLDFPTQLMAVLLGLAAALVAYRHAKVWSTFGWPLYLISVGLLVLVSFYGNESGGAVRWLEIGQFQLQPSEIAKLALILMQAKLLASRAQHLDSPGPLLLSALYVATVSWLVFLQPDLGTVVVIVVIWLAQLFVSQLPKRTFLLLIAIILLAVPAAYPFLADYQRDRIETFLNPSLSAEAEGYNVLQATIAIGSGGILGKGLDAGSQSQLNFLPAQHTDFIFAVIAEKLGLLGGLSVVLAFCLLIIRLSTRVIEHESQFVRIVGFGVVAAIAVPFGINVGMNLGLFPVTGVPLPLVSAGGTHLIVELTMLGLVGGLTARAK